MKNIIITGASKGIGKAIAKSLRKKYHIINIDIVENKMDGVFLMANKGKIMNLIMLLKRK